MHIETLKAEAKTLALLTQEARICASGNGFYGALLAILDRRAARLARILNGDHPDPGLPDMFSPR